MCSGEHDLKYYNLFQIYLKLYEVSSVYLPALSFHLITHYLCTDNFGNLFENSGCSY